ncbi:MAG: M60 family metallopeptidase, partial [Muribaculaceae bacterium]|nr:M60 family metallopeptidase [Muribaculaceae bacterium]
FVAYSSDAIRLSADGATQEIPLYSRVDVSASSDSWLETSVEDGKLIISAGANPYSGQRTATVTVRTSVGNSTFTVTQLGMNIGTLAKDLIKNGKVTPSSVTATSQQTGNEAALAIDGKNDTFWHSAFSGFNPNNSNEWPRLTFTFKDSPTIASMLYTPRPSSETNGNWGKVRVYMRHTGENSYSLMTDKVYDLGGSSEPYVFTIPEGKRDNIANIRFEIQTGVNTNTSQTHDYASCAEMTFSSSAAGVPIPEADSKYFADAVYSALKPGVTQKDVDKITTPFLQKLAQMMLDGDYDGARMTTTHEPLWNVETLSAQWNAPGKYYDRTQGATGVKLTRGNYAIFVDGLTDSKPNTTLKVTGWYAMPDDPEKKSYCSEETYTLTNGLNVITRTTAWDGLAYLDNYDTEGLNSGTAKPLKIHIIGGEYNGVITNTMTNAEAQQILDNAVYPCIDLMGSRVHSVWEVDAVKAYANGQYVRYINTLDQLIIWEHRVLGLEKYNRVPQNKTLAYVNYDYYMYQGGKGVTFKYDTQSRVCSPDNLLTRDDDAIWGLSHEWGHQHQMTPYFCWTGCAEMTNNVFSAYNVIHMGYPINSSSYYGRYPKDKWEKTVQRIFIDDNYDRTPSDPKDGETKTANSDGIVLACRQDAATAAQAGKAFTWCNELKQLAINQSKLPSKRSEDAKRALNAIEAYSSSNGELCLAPYVNLMYYFMEENANRAAGDERPTFIQDMFEALRQTDDAKGSVIEKQDGVDKYELLASIFNGNKSSDPSINKTAAFKQQYPNSVWTTRGYIPTSTVSWQANSAPFILNWIRKASRLTGYNLWSYFERWGVFTVCALEQGDYGIQYYVFTEAMYDEFKADMEALEKAGVVRPLPDNVRNDITYCKPLTRPRPTIPNDRPLTADEN